MDNVVVKDENVSPGEVLILKEKFQDLIAKHKDTGAEIGFFDSLFGNQGDRIKDKIFVDVVNVFEGSGFDPHSEDGFFDDFSHESLARVLTDVIFEYACETDGDPEEALEKIKEIIDQVRESQKEIDEAA